MKLSDKATTHKVNKTNLNILENNKIIAEFMGYNFDGVEYDIPEHTTFVPFEYKKATTIHCFTTSLFKVVDLKFHCSWNWLIPVCKKIKEVGGTEKKYSVEFELAVDKLDMQSMYVFSVKFIKWYNELKKYK